MRNRATAGTLEGLRMLWDGDTLAGLGDGPLLARFAARRDEAAELAFAALIRRHGPMVLRVCEQLLGDHHAAEDAFQAVFLVLARRAGSIREPDRLAPWLHGVAIRTAREARTRAARRRRVEAARESREVADSSTSPELPLIQSEAVEALQAAINQLPGRYRDPVVLCELEGLTHQEAALRLRCPVATVGVRLMRARDRLRGHLARRGLDSPAALVAVGFSPQRAIPAGLLESTLGGSVRFATSRVAAGTVPALVVTLAEKVLLTMTLGKWKLAAAVILGLGLTATGGWAAWHRPAEAQEGRPGAAIPEAKQPEVVPEPAPVPEFPMIGIARPISRDVRDYVDYIGRVEPARTLELRVQIGGLLEKVACRNGQEVKEGALLFEVAAKSCQADVDRAAAEVAQVQARVKLRSSELKYAEQLANQKAVSQNEVTRYKFEVAQVEAALIGAEAGLSQARRNLEAAQIRAPFAGKVSVRLAEPGMVVKGGETVLGTLASVDPVAVSFEVDATTFLKIRRQIRGKSGDANLIAVQAALPDETGLPHRGQFDFDAAQAKPSADTFQMRAEFPNADRDLVPGLTVRVRIETGEPHRELLVPEGVVRRTEVNEHGYRKEICHVVNDRDIVEAREIWLGAVYDGLRVVKKGLKADDRFVLGSPAWGLPGMTIKPPAGKP